MERDLGRNFFKVDFFVFFLVQSLMIWFMSSFSCDTWDKITLFWNLHVSLMLLVWI